MDEEQKDATPRQKSSRDPDELRRRLEAWFTAKVGAAAAPRVGAVSSPSTNGMSSETLLFDASWQEQGGPCSGSFVARLEPETSDVPVFPTYDMESQFRILEVVGRHSDVPVPRVRWLENDPQALGARFFVMDRVEGRVPPDVMPYTMESWLLDADPEQRRHLQDSTVAVLASLHSIPVAGADVGFLEFDLPGATPLRRHVENQRRYFYDFVQEGRPFPVIDKAFAWLEEHWPEDEGESVISWGDSRIGNVMYDGFDPVAVLDWEMAAIAPREVDIAWMIFIHIFFQDITERAGLPGLPDFMLRGPVTEEYERRSGYRPRNMDFFEMYAALRHAIVMARVFARSVHFDGAEWPDEPETVIYHRDVMIDMLGGKFRSRDAVG